MSLSNILQQLTEFDTPLLANTINYIDPVPTHEIYMSGLIQSRTPELGPIAGVAFTCELDSSTPLQEGDWDGFYAQLEDMEQTEEPAVWIAKVVGVRPEHECALGDGMAKLLRSVGCLGAITDGGVRDVSGFLTVPFAAHSRYVIAHHCALRMKSAGQPVELGGLKISPGDIIHANTEGIIRIPRSCVQQLPQRAAQMRALEHEAHALLRQTGVSIATKRAAVQGLLDHYGFAKQQCLSRVAL
jgi:4-hydroxy-4-methyl-2-oxoglutarate aldolase